MDDQSKRFMVARVNTVDHENSEPPQEDQESVEEMEEAPASKAEAANGDTLRHSAVGLEDAAAVDEDESRDDFTCHKTWTHMSWKYLMTRDVLPKLDYYRNLQSIVGRSSAPPVRPRLEDLHNPEPPAVDPECVPLTCEVQRDDGGQSTEASQPSNAPKFGWVKGVFVRCLLNIWGVMLFLRLSWVTGQAGILGGIAIVLGANAVTTITALSMSAISTNGLIRGGGTYYMISRSLGPEFGGAIGLIFSFANAVASSMYIVGFCESLLDLLSGFDLKIVDGGINDTRIVGTTTLLVLIIICILGGMAWESRAQLGLLFILLLAMADVLVGAVVGPITEEQKARGFLGFNATLLRTNLKPDFRPFEGRPQNTFSVFAVFFPACTGILAGANISGDLKDPSSAIPKGTLLSILITCLTYIVFIIVVGATVVRDATGDPEMLANWTFLNCSLEFGVNLTTKGCPYGIHNSFQALELMSIFGPLIYAGCFAATLSSALASLVSAPKVFQALCKDELFPFIKPFGRGYGKEQEPYRAYGLTLVISFAFIAIGELNSIASIISNFFLAAYALINFSCFHASFQRSPGWRPTFKYYNMWLSLIGSIMCGAVMVLIEWWTAILTAAIILILYLVVAYRKLDINWGSSVQSQSYRQALSAVFSLNRFDEHVKTFRPQILLLSGTPSLRPELVHFAHSITKNMALLVVAECITEDIPYGERVIRQKAASKWLHKERVKAFYTLASGSRLDGAAKALMSFVGLGKLRPNVVMLGFKSDWDTCSSQSLKGYFGTIHSALDLHYGVCILRVKGQEESLSDSHGESSISSSADVEAKQPTSLQLNGDVRERKELDDESRSESQEALQRPGGRKGDGETLVRPRIEESSPVGKRDTSSVKSAPEQMESYSSVPSSSSRKSSGANSDLMSNRERAIGGSYLDLRGSKGGNGPQFSKSNVDSRWKGADGVTSLDVVKSVRKLITKQTKGTIDVWWLFDDGGLTLLLPYILTTRSSWEGCKLRIFCICGKPGDLEREHRKMSELIRKFRIDISDVIMIDDFHKRPSEDSMSRFNDLIRKFKGKDCDDEEEEEEESKISEEELQTTHEKTRRHVRLRELLLQHSLEANLIAMTLPMPTKGRVSAPLYLSWLETLTKDLPPFLLVRGNQTSVLTFYS